MMAVMREALPQDQAPALSLPLHFRLSPIYNDLSAREGRDRNNLIWLAIAGACAPLAGSTLSVVLWSAYIWALPSLAVGHISIRRDRAIYWAAAAAGFYGLVKLAFGIGHSGLSSWHYWPGLLIFFSPILVASRMKMTEPAKTLDVFVLAAGFSTLLAVPVAGYQAIVEGVRADAFCGNPGVFAVMALLFGSIGALNVAAPHRSRRWLGVACYLATVFCVMASGMRAVWLALPVTTFFIVWVAAGNLSRSVMLRGLAGAVVLVAVGIAFAAEPVVHRVAMFGHDIELMQEEQDYDSSTGRRILMLRGGWEAVKKAPLTGYGLEDRMSALQAQLPREQRGLVAFTHPHSGYLAALLDAGILGLIAVVVLIVTPMAIGFFGPRDAGWRLRAGIGSILTASYGLTGATNILFEHDLMDSAFVLTLIVLAAMVPDVGTDEFTGEKE